MLCLGAHFTQLAPSPGCISSVLQRPPALLHLDDILPTQPAQLELAVEVPDTDADQLIIADVTGWRGEGWLRPETTLIEFLINVKFTVSII